MLVCRDPAAEIQFLKAAFATVELSRRQSPIGSILHATLAIGPSLVSRAPHSDGSSSVLIYLYAVPPS